MKITKVLVAFAMLIVGFSLSSCEKSSNDEISTKSHEVVLYSELTQSISDYDSNFDLKLPEETRKGGILSPFRKLIDCICQIVVADIEGGAKGAGLGSKFDKGKSVAGAVTGAIVGGVTSSGSKFIDLVFNKKDTKPGSLLKKIPRPATYQQTGSVVGQFHNEMMKELFDKYEKENVIFDDITSELICKDVVDLTQKHLGKDFVRPDQNSLNEFVQTSDEITKELKGLNYEQAIKHLRDCKYGNTEEMNIIANYLVKILSINDLKYRELYTTGYKDLIQKSKIPENSKIMILCATSTALNSLNLWESSL